MRHSFLFKQEMLRCGYNDKGKTIVKKPGGIYKQVSAKMPKKDMAKKMPKKMFATKADEKYFNKLDKKFSK